MTDRAQGFVRSLAAARKPVKPVVLHGKNNFQGGVELAQKLLAQHPEVTAIFAGQRHDGVRRHSRAASKPAGAFPDDVSVIGFDNVELSTIVNPPLTTIHQPKYEIGQAAVEILLRLAGRGEHQAAGTSRCSASTWSSGEAAWSARHELNRRELLQAAGTGDGGARSCRAQPPRRSHARRTG